MYVYTICANYFHSFCTNLAKLNGIFIFHFSLFSISCFTPLDGCSFHFFVVDFFLRAAVAIKRTL